MDAFSDRTKLELRKFADAFVALQQADEDDRGDRKSRDSLLLNYVFSFEMAWQSMRLVLADRGCDGGLGWASADGTTQDGPAG